MQRSRCRRTEQRHLKAAVFLHDEPVVGRNGVADSEPDLFAALVNAAPLGVRPIASKIRGEASCRCIYVRAFDEHRHRQTPPDENDDAEWSGDGPRQRAEKWHRMEKFRLLIGSDRAIVYRSAQARNRSV